MKRLGLILAICALLTGSASGQLGGGLIFPGPGTHASSGSTPFGITFIGSSNSTTAGTSFTFTSQGIGTSDPTRIVAVGIGSLNNVGIAISSVTIGGVSATQVPGAAAQTTSGANIDIWYAAVPTGSTATIVVNFASSQARAAIDVYSVVGTSAAFSSAANNSNNAAVSLTATATVPAGGGALAVIVVHSSSSVGIVTGTNMTLDQNGAAFGNSVMASGNNISASGSQAFEFDWTPGVDAAMAVATFSP